MASTENVTVKFKPCDHLATTTELHTHPQNFTLKFHYAIMLDMSVHSTGGPHTPYYCIANGD